MDCKLSLFLTIVETAGTEGYFRFQICGRQAITLGLSVSSHIAGGITNTILFESERELKSYSIQQSLWSLTEPHCIHRLWQPLINTESCEARRTHPHPPFPRHTPSTVRPAETKALRQGLVCIERLKNMSVQQTANGTNWTSQAVWLGETAWLKCIAAIRAQA